ncbi:Ku protein [Streptomyces sp. NPDC046866]|uniref:non-homologous end joining protein Ku n=1 Tax=Streptomyces sp. NPDC046866 TaxID=3154921 RepID=UPI003454D8DB
MRSIWNGAISFGLVSIPIKLVNATESHSISFRQIHLEDGGRIRYRKVCELDGEEVPGAEIGKGYEEPDGSIIPITDEDLAQLPIATAKTIEIVSFVPADEIDPLQMDAAYYLAANGATAAKPYTLLREALKRSHRVAIAKYALRGRERLGMLRVVDDVIAMHGLLWPDEIRVPEGVAPEGTVQVREAELDLADALMATLGEVEMASLRDEYREAVEAMIEAKAGGAFEPPAEAAVEPAGGKVIDLMAALEKSVRAAKASRGAGSEAGGGGDDTGAAEAGGAGRGEAGRGEAEVRPIRRKSAAAAPKAVGGKKSTASTAAKKKTAAASGGGTTRKSTSSATKTASSTARKSATKSTAKTAKAAQTGKTAKTAKTATAAATKKAAPRKRTSA